MAFRLTGFLMHEGFTQDNYTKCLWCGKERGASRMCVLCGVSLCSEKGCFWKFHHHAQFPQENIMDDHDDADIDSTTTHVSISPLLH